MNQKILVVVDQLLEANHIRALVAQAGHQVIGVACSVNLALEMIADKPPSLVVLDIGLRGSLTGIHLGQMLKQRGVAFVYLSDDSDPDTLAMAKATEPYGFLVKPFRDKDFLVTIEIALYLHSQRAISQPSTTMSRNRRLPASVGNKDISRPITSSNRDVSRPITSSARPIANGNRDIPRPISSRQISSSIGPIASPASSCSIAGTPIIGESPQFQSILREAEIVAPADSSVLLLGETGTGKEVIAGLIHGLSQRKQGPYIKVNCAAMPPTLIESILFGHEKGAFTDATQRRRGKFEQADNGTIFLDEIGEMALDMQVKLLRVLQEKEVELLGGEETVKVNCRIIAATNKDLGAEVAAGRFRPDLYYRLNVFPITLPPLRERLEDIPILARHYVQRYSLQMGKTTVTLSPSVIEDLQQYPWPGNIRELEHTIERLIILNNEDPVRWIDLPGGSGLSARREPAKTMTSTLEEMEREHIIEVLRQCKGKVAGRGGAAEYLNIHASTLNSRMKKLGIHKLRQVT